MDRLRQQLEEQLQEARRQLVAESARAAALQTQARAACSWKGMGVWQEDRETKF